MIQTPLVIVRPEPGNAATLATARSQGLPAFGEPLFEIEAVAWDPPLDPIDALLIASANAVRHAGPGLERFKSTPAYVVGEATGDAAARAGLTVSGVGSGGIQALADMLSNDRRERVLRLAGAARVRFVPPTGIEIVTRVVYRAVPRPIGPSMATLLNEPAVVLLHSAESARHFATECSRQAIARNRIALACLGPRIAAAAGHGWGSVASAGRPNDSALLALAARMCQARAFGDTDDHG